MSEEIQWNNVEDIIQQYHSLKPNQGLKIYYKTIDFDAEEIIIISQIIPYGFDYDRYNEIPINNRRMGRYLRGTEFITWHIYNNEFTICLTDITKIEIVDNAIDEILKEVELEESKQ